MNVSRRPIRRKVARAVTEGHTELVVITPEKVREFLGPEKFFNEVAERTGEPGVVTGLAYTPNGGDITVDTWGTKQLGGTIEVVLDSDMEPESDSVTWVRLQPL